MCSLSSLISPLSARHCLVLASKVRAPAAAGACDLSETVRRRAPFHRKRAAASAATGLATLAAMACTDCGAAAAQVSVVSWPSPSQRATPPSGTSAGDLQGQGRQELLHVFGHRAPFLFDCPLPFLLICRSVWLPSPGAFPHIAFSLLANIQH